MPLRTSASCSAVAVLIFTFAVSANAAWERPKASTRAMMMVLITVFLLALLPGFSCDIRRKPAGVERIVCRRSEERRVGKECGSRRGRDRQKRNEEHAREEVGP